MTPAETIRSAREALGLSQLDVAAAVGVNKRTYLRWESGDSLPRNHNRLRLCWVLGLDPEVLS